MLGLIVAANKPGGFTDDDVQLLSIFAGPAASFMRSRQIFDAPAAARRAPRARGRAGRRHGGHAEAPAAARPAVATRLQQRPRLRRTWPSTRAAEAGRLELRGAGAGDSRPSAGTLELVALGRCAAGPPAALAGAAPRPPSSRSRCARASTPWACWTCAGAAGAAFGDEEVEPALAPSPASWRWRCRRRRAWPTTERLAAADGDALRPGPGDGGPARPAGALRQGDRGGGPPHPRRPRVGRSASSPRDGVLQLFAAWAREPRAEPYALPRLPPRRGHRRPRGARPAAGHGQRRRQRPELRAERTNPVARHPVRARSPTSTRSGRHRALRRAERHAAARGRPPSPSDDLEYLTRFAGQLSIAVANSMAFAARARAQRAARPRQHAAARDRGQPVARAHPGDRGAPHPRGLPASRWSPSACPTTRPARTASRRWPTRDRAPRGWRSFPLHAGIVGRALPREADRARPRRAAGPRLHRPRPVARAARSRSRSCRATTWWPS